MVPTINSELALMYLMWGAGIYLQVSSSGRDHIILSWFYYKQLEAEHEHERVKYAVSPLYPHTAENIAITSREQLQLNRNSSSFLSNY